MAESKVKGEVFRVILKLVAYKWGTDALKIIGQSPDKYLTEQWYPYSEFCDILAAVKSTVGNNNPMIIYQLGFNTIKKDKHWQNTFISKNPVEVFNSTEHQDTQYKVGTYSAVGIGPKHIRLTMNCPDCRLEWCEFYRGRLQGVLELTGRTGVVHLMPSGEDKTQRVYDVKWG